MESALTRIRPCRDLETRRSTLSDITIGPGLKVGPWLLVAFPAGYVGSRGSIF